MTKEQFQDAFEVTNAPTKMVVAVKLPTGATELIINTEQIGDKVEYYLNAYDDEMRLKANPAVHITGVLFA
jgi:hypothetical protein